MGLHHTGVFLLVILASAVSIKATDLCPFDGTWKYHDQTGSCVGVTVETVTPSVNPCSRYKGGSRRVVAGHLVFILDKNTDDFVKGLLKTSLVGRAYIGLDIDRTSGKYLWGNTVKQTVSYMGWAPGHQLNYTWTDKFVITANGWEKYNASARLVCQVDGVIPVPTMSCPRAAEVGEQSSNFTCTLNVATAQVTLLELAFQRARQVKVSCSQKACPGNTTYEAYVRTEPNFWSAPLRVKKVQRIDEGIWSCSVTVKGGQKVESSFCNLKVYTVPPTVDCKVSYSQNVMTVSCTTGRMYPQAVCLWDIDRTPNVQKPGVNKTIQNVQGSSDGVIVYRGECQASITWPEAGTFLFSVSVHPSVPGLDGTQPSTVKKSERLKVVVEPPKDKHVLYNSQGPIMTPHLEVTENQTVLIFCPIPGGKPEVYSTVIKCYPQQKRESQGDSALIVLTITPDFHNQSCSCFGRHLTGVTREASVTFLVVDPPVDSHHQTVIVVSAVAGVVLVIAVVVAVVCVQVRRRLARGARAHLSRGDSHTSTAHKRPSILDHDHETYEVPVSGWLPSGKTHKIPAPDESNEEAVYLNTSLSEAFMISKRDQDNVYENMPAPGKMEESILGVRNEGRTANYDCLAFKDTEINEDDNYTMVNLNNAPPKPL